VAATAMWTTLQGPWLKQPPSLSCVVICAPHAKRIPDEEEGGQWLVGG
jgi:hypothetical protein